MYFQTKLLSDLNLSLLPRTNIQESDPGRGMQKTKEPVEGFDKQVRRSDVQSFIKADIMISL